MKLIKKTDIICPSCGESEELVIFVHCERDFGYDPERAEFGFSCKCGEIFSLKEDTKEEDG